MDSSGKFLMKLTDPEKDCLRKNDGCFNCRKVKVNHIANDCPEDHSGSGDLVKGMFLKKEVKKDSSVSALVVESEPDSEYYSRPKSVPTIKVATQVAGATLPSSLADSGAMINVLSEDKVVAHSIPTHPMPPVRIREPVNPQGTVVNRKVISKVGIPDERWESRQPEFVVAPLKDYDAILGMPFLATEGILINPAQSKVILPEPLGGDLNTETEEKGDDLSETEETVGAEWSVPSICPKVCRAKAPQTDVSWIQAWQRAEQSRA